MARRDASKRSSKGKCRDEGWFFTGFVGRREQKVVWIPFTLQVESIDSLLNDVNVFLRLFGQRVQDNFLRALKAHVPMAHGNAMGIR
jgi:hypothetical protein